MDFRLGFSGVCTRIVEFKMDKDFIVSDINFLGGCPGNTSGVAKLASGRHVDEIIPALLGTICERRGTSCPDQFAKALLQAKITVMDEDITKN
ncbi:MAG: TIGR03905 family TSCPD domain-containing protein [Defluviitaleaceae bacterium]|nr:TIGR03905 family TSCPD domain-containing protein [Defluviitaleaceae bacterium]